MKVFRFLITYLELITFLVSLIAFRKYKHSRLKYLPLYFGIVSLVELTAFHSYVFNNIWMYNALCYFQINFFCLTFLGYLPQFQKRIAIFGTLFFNVFYIGSFLVGLNRFFYELSSFGYVVGSLIVFVLIMAVFNELLKIDNSKGMTHNLLFWTAFGFFIMYSVLIPYTAISNSEVFSKGKLVIMRTLWLTTVLISHLILIFGFIWSKKKYTY